MSRRGGEQAGGGSRPGNEGAGDEQAGGVSRRGGEQAGGHLDRLGKLGFLLSDCSLGPH
jgi:hypothetical protein